MITEDYVSFETAKLLKKKGFHELCHYNYHCDGFFYQHKKKDYNGKNYEKLDSEWYSAPTLQMAMKWLRKVHNYNIEVDTIGQKFLDTLFWRSVIYNLEQDMEYYYEDNFKSYEEAAEAAIKYCLEHLI